LRSKSKFEPQIDLLEVRRQLIAMRSQHMDDRKVTLRINRLLGKLAHLHEPENPAHERRLKKLIKRTTSGFFRAVEVGFCATFSARGKGIIARLLSFV
jgi:hypothetical protein